MLSLVGVWSVAALSGAQDSSDEVLIFLPDGTGRLEFWSWQLNALEYFTWERLNAERLNLRGMQAYQMNEAGQIVEEEPMLDLIGGIFEIGEEESSDGLMRYVLRVNLGPAFANVYAYESNDLTAWAQPRWPE